MPILDGGKVLIVDDDVRSVALLSRMMGNLGYTTVSAADGEAALDAVARENPDVVLLDVNMPGLSGLDVCRRLKSDSATRLIPVVLLTGLAAVEDRVRGIDAGADDFISKPFAAVELEARVRSLTRLKRYTDELDSAAAVILSLARTIEARDHYTQGHCERLAEYATALGAHLGLREDQRLALHRGGYLHDVGKVGIPDAILLKAGPLDPAEYHRMQQHTVIGDTICRELRLLDDVTPIVRHHHERLDGTGYPDGLAGDGIPLLAQIMGIVDTYDAALTERSYKPERSTADAVCELREDVRNGWKSASLVEAFVSILPGLMERGSRVMSVDTPSTTVLIVDDESPIRQIERRALEASGYLVTEASGAVQAIEMLSHGRPLDLLISDLDMPGVKGDEMVRRIRAARPGLKVLYVTGHIDLLMGARPLCEGEAFLEKPFNAAGLREAVALLVHGRLS